MGLFRAMLGLGFKTISIRDYRETVQKEDHFLVDVRTKPEFRSGHVVKAVNIPLDELASRLDDIPMDQPVVVICESGSRSHFAAATLAGAGYQTVLNIDGGTALWASMGLPLKR